ncbi:hypothetical protein SmJEL517_g02748 [Synchytrium microbalum]|uniref:Cullin family profile domain-containing protein n=1 Tax=Synchytrium microbalum TaxID=1806994 RepID=A0A507C5B9_9FUNG|nr:uncharacterized protein SmJEL517_g02748 [Synchytrium microbalum]TPX34681.1 hypothetical protein SmJEL517_g02748 [Synchytrium microbalum]
MDTVTAWKFAIEALKNGKHDTYVTAALEVLESSHLESHLLDAFLEDVQNTCRSKIAAFQLGPDSLDAFQKLLLDLHDLLDHYLHCLNAWPNPTASQRLLRAFRAQVCVSMPLSFHELARIYLKRSISMAGRLVWAQSTPGLETLLKRDETVTTNAPRSSPIQPQSAMSDTFAPSKNRHPLISLADVEFEDWSVFINTDNEEEDVDPQSAYAFMEGFVKVCQHVSMLGLSDIVFGQAETLLYSYVEDQAVNVCGDDFERAFLKPCLCWLAKAILPWLELLVGGRKGMMTLNQWQTRLEDHVYRVFCDTLTRKLFDIIVAYPDSLPALEDLKACLAKTDQKWAVGEAFRTATRGRLLHHGALTVDILMLYVSSIKCLDLLDPSGQLVKVTDPIQQYLRGRDDAVRSIIKILLGDADKRMDLDEPPESDNSEELTKLVEIYENKEVFAREFQSMLMEKLLAKTDYNFTDEAQQLEYLKVKFGESALSMCDVMMKDAMESKRVDALIHSEHETLPNLHAMVLSRLFWPKLPSETMVYPPEIQRHLTDYSNAFAITRTPKEFHVVPALGTATLELEVSGVTREFVVPVPVAAVIIMFEERDQWYVDTLAAQMDVAPGFLRSKLQAWVSYGVLEESEHDLYRLVKANEGDPDGRTSPEQNITYTEDDMDVEAEEEGDDLPPAIAGMVAPMVKAILTNHGNCDVHKIQFHINNVLPVKLTVEMLKKQLDKMVEDQLVDVSGISYSVRR